MAITIDWPSKVISVPKADTTLIQTNPTEIRELDLDTFRKAIKALEDTEDGIVFLRTHDNFPSQTVSGVQLARVVVLVNGYTTTFEDGQYAVNLVGANSNVGDLINVNQVSIRSGNSAGLIQTREIQYASFEGGVWIDTLNGVVGEPYPNGTPLKPVGNLGDAVAIANVRGFGTLYILGNILVDNGGNYDGFIFIGESQSKSLLTISVAASVFKSEFYDASVTGTLDGNAKLKNCRISNLNYIDGFIEQCVLDVGTITLSGTSDAHFLDCWSGVPGITTPIIDLGGSGTALALRNYNGGITLKNKTGLDVVSIDLNSGHVILDSTVTAGLITIRGVGKLTDNSMGATVDASYLISPKSIWDYELEPEGNYSAKDIVNVGFAVLAGQVEVSPDGTTITFKTPNGNITRAIVTAASDGSRSTVIITPGI